MSVDLSEFLTGVSSCTVKSEAMAPELKGETHPVDALANLLKACTPSWQIYIAAFDVAQWLNPKGAVFLYP